MMTSVARLVSASVLIGGTTLLSSTAGTQANDVEALLAAPTGLVPLNPRYHKPYDFGVPTMKVIDSANQVAKAVYQRIDHHGGKPASYWRDLTFKVVGDVIAGFDYTPKKELRDFLLAQGSIAFIRSTFTGETGPNRTSIKLPYKILSQKNIKELADAWLMDPDPRGGCASTYLSLYYFFEGIAGSDKSACGSVAVGDQFVRKGHAGQEITPRHGWVWLRIGSEASGFILQSDPHWGLIPKSEKKTLNGVTDWDTVAAGWLPASTELFLTTHFIKMDGTDRPAINNRLPKASLAWSPMTVDEWKNIDWNAYLSRKRAFDAALKKAG